MTLTLPPAGSIGLVHVEGIQGGLIRLGQFLDGQGFEDYEHAFILETNTDLASATVIEAEPGGVRRSFLNEYHGRKVLWLPCPPQHSVSVVAQAQFYLGRPYSDVDYVDIAAHHLGLPVAKVLQKIVEHDGHVICSMMCDQAALCGNWILFPDGEWPGYVTPGTLARLAPAGAVPELLT